MRSGLFRDELRILGILLLMGAIAALVAALAGCALPKPPPDCRRVVGCCAERCEKDMNVDRCLMDCV